MLKMHLSSAKFGKQLRWKSTILWVGLLRCSCLSLIGSRSNSSYGSEKIITSAVLIFGPDSHVNLRASLLDVRDHPEAIVRCLLFLMGWRGIIFLSESKCFSFNTRLVWVSTPFAVLINNHGSSGHHQDCQIFSSKSQPRPSFATSWVGGRIQRPQNLHHPIPSEGSPVPPNGEESTLGCVKFSWKEIISIKFRKKNNSALRNSCIFLKNKMYFWVIFKTNIQDWLHLEVVFVSLHGAFPVIFDAKSLGFPWPIFVFLMRCMVRFVLE